MMQERENSTFLTILWIALAFILSGGFIGAITNTINGYISPVYFQNVMGWKFQNIWSASIAQGIFEGLMYGIFFSIIFCATTGIVSRGQITFRFALPYIFKTIAIVFLSWILGGLIAMGLATLSTDFYKQKFPQAPETFKDILAFAWVGGSIWGCMLGGLLGLIFGIVGVINHWKNKKSNE